MDYFLVEDRAFVESEMLPAIERDGSWNGDFQFRHFRGAQAVPVAYNLVRLARADGTRLGLAMVSRDLRERKCIEDGLRLLSRTGAAIVGSLDYQRTLQNIAWAFVEGFAAYCVIDVMPANGPWERTVEHRDPPCVPRLMGLSRPKGNHPIARAIEAGESCFAAINEQWARSLDNPLDPDRLDAVRRLHVRSIISVPVMTPSGEVVGALTCALDDVNIRKTMAPTTLASSKRSAGAPVRRSPTYDSMNGSDALQSKCRRHAYQRACRAPPASSWMPHIGPLVTKRTSAAIGTTPSDFLTSAS
jgi:hypothetical protein